MLHMLKYNFFVSRPLSIVLIKIGHARRQVVCFIIETIQGGIVSGIPLESSAFY